MDGQNLGQRSHHKVKHNGSMTIYHPVSGEEYDYTRLMEYCGIAESTAKTRIKEVVKGQRPIDKAFDPSRRRMMYTTRLSSQELMALAREKEKEEKMAALQKQIQEENRKREAAAKRLEAIEDAEEIISEIISEALQKSSKKNEIIAEALESGYPTVIWRVSSTDKEVSLVDLVGKEPK